MQDELVKLKELLEESERSNEVDKRDAVMMLNDYLWKCRPIVDFYLDISLSVLREDAGLFDGLQSIIRSARYVYSMSGLDNCIEDSEYDILCEKEEQVLDMDADFEDPLGPVKEKGYHLYPSLRGTLDKVYSMEYDKKRRSYTAWLNHTELVLGDTLGEDVNLENEEIYVFPKWDGVSVIFEFDAKKRLIRALTRGYTKLNEALIITDIFKGIPLDHLTSIDNQGLPFGVKTEVMTSEEGLEEYNQEHPKKRYKNSRSFASALINQEEVLEPSVLKRYLNIIPLRYALYTEKGEGNQKLHPRVGTYPYLRTTATQFDAIEDFAEQSHYVNGLRCDGIVIYLINEKYQKILGRKNDRSKFEVAYKFTEECAYATIKDVAFSVGLYGNITPILEIKPVTLKGNTITHISLGSVAVLESLRLGKKDVIKVHYDIIPTCSFDEKDPKCVRSGEDRFVAPRRCPSCGELLTRTNGTLFCENKKCPHRKMGRILNHIRVMNIQYIGTALLEQLFQEELVTSIPDLYKLEKKKDELLLLENFGKRKFKRLIGEIERTIERPIDEARLCESLSLEGLGYSTFRTIFKEMDLEELLDVVKNKDMVSLTRLPGIGKVKAEWILEGFSDKSTLKLLEYLNKHLHVVPVRKEKPKFTVVFTSFQSTDPRKDRITKLVDHHGGLVEERITKDTDFLIVPEKGVGTKKEIFAKDHKIPICTPDQFIEMIRV